MASQRVGQGDDGTLGYVRVGENDALDVLCVDAALPQLGLEVFAALERDRAVVVTPDQIAAAKVGPPRAGAAVIQELALVQALADIAAGLERGRDQELADPAPLQNLVLCVQNERVDARE